MAICEHLWVTTMTRRIGSAMKPSWGRQVQMMMMMRWTLWVTRIHATTGGSECELTLRASIRDREGSMGCR